VAFILWGEGGNHFSLSLFPPRAPDKSEIMPFVLNTTLEGQEALCILHIGKTLPQKMREREWKGKVLRSRSRCGWNHNIVREPEFFAAARAPGKCTGIKKCAKAPQFFELKI
jgi:hypothetical protein